MIVASLVLALLLARGFNEPCTGSVVGRVALADGTPAAGEWVQVAGLGARVAPDGVFRVDGVPPGRHNAAARHATFAFVLGACGEVVDVGEVEYPIFHSRPSPVPVGREDPAARVLERFMDARIGRRDADVLGMLADGFRSSPPRPRGELTPASSPCWYHFDVVSLVRWAAPGAGQPPAGTVDALVRVYTAFDQTVGVPMPTSFAQTVRLVETPAGWRVARTQVLEYRDEPLEPHGTAGSACRVGARPTAWPASALPASGAPPAWPALALGALLVAAGYRLRARRRVSWRG